MKKKKELPMPKIKSQVDLINKKTKFYTVVAAIGIVVVLCVGFLARKESKREETSNIEYIQKNVVNQYVCKIVGAEPEAEIIAVECLTK